MLVIMEFVKSTKYGRDRCTSGVTSCAATLPASTVSATPSGTGAGARYRPASCATRATWVLWEPSLWAQKRRVSISYVPIERALSLYCARRL